jgi:DNA polymerase-3 subunit epsilon
MILFFDTETSDLPDLDKRASDPSQPHIVQLGAIVTDDHGQEIGLHKILVKPAGWTISDAAFQRHHISQEYAEQCGAPESWMAEILYDLIRHASLVVGHNIQFDKFLARIAARRFSLLTDADDAWWKAMPTFCTMRQMTDICGLPGNYGKCKWPTLQEAYGHAFGRKFDGAHDALADVRACKEIYFWHQKHFPI